MARPAGEDNQGPLVESIERALAAGERRRATELIVGNLAALCVAGHAFDVGWWLSSIPVHALDDDVDLAVEHCGGLLFVGREEWTVRWGALFGRAVARRGDVLARLRLFEAIGWASQGWVTNWGTAVSQAHDLRPVGTVEPFDELNDAWHARLLTLQGRHDEAVSLATSLVTSQRQLVADAPAYSVQAGCLAGSHDPSAADVAHAALDTWRQAGSPDLIGMVDALCVAADQALLDDDVVSAEELATKAAALVDDVHTNFWDILVAVRLAAVDERRGQYDTARARIAVARDRAISQRVAPLLIDQLPFRPQRRVRTQTRDGVPGWGGGRAALTDRERTVLQLLQSHLTLPEIARNLFVSHDTVKTHVKRIYRKLGVTSRSDAIEAARQLGLLP